MSTDKMIGGGTVLTGCMVVAVVSFRQAPALTARARVLIAASAVCAITLLSGTLAQRSEAVFGKYKATLTLTIAQSAPVGTGPGQGYIDLSATGEIQSHQKLCRGDRPLELWGRRPDGRADNLGNRKDAPKGSFALAYELPIESDDIERGYPPGAAAEFWVVAPKDKRIRFHGGYPLLCKRAVSPHVFVTVPVPPPPPD